MTKILSLDQSTNDNGFCLMTNGKIKKSGMVSFKSKEHYSQRIARVKTWMLELIDKHKPDIVSLEEPPPAAPGKSGPVLYGLMGALETALIDRGQNYLIVPVGTWRKDLGIVPDLEIICPECGEKLSRLTPAHIKRCCKMTPAEFAKKHGKNIFCRDDRTALKQATIEYVKREYCIECETDDEADAIAMATYVKGRIG